MLLGPNLLKIDINLCASFKKIIGDGANTLFWKDIWIGGAPLKDYYRRLYALELIKDCCIKEKFSNNVVDSFASVSLPAATTAMSSSGPLIWTWRLPVTRVG